MTAPKAMTTNMNPTNLPNAAKNISDLLAPWTGGFGGIPPFDRVRVEEFPVAIEEGIALNLSELEAIAENPAPPDFDNTIAAMERSGHALDRAATIFYIWSSSMSTPELRSVEGEIGSKLAAFGDRVTQNEALFKRIESVYENREAAGLSDEESRLTWRMYTNFVRAGARLDSASKARLAEINQELSALFTEFSQRLLADESEKFLVLNDAADLVGLPPQQCDAAAEIAAAKGLENAWVIANTRSSVDPFLTYSERRDLREKVWRMFVSRGDNGDANDTKELIPRILSLRAERAGLLGFETHAHWRLENAMAKTPERAMELLEAVWKPSIARVREEVADMQALADAEQAGITIEPWDYAFYMEKVRKEKFDFDENLLKPYLQLENLRDGMFWAAGELFGLDFSEVEKVPVFHPDVRVWEVTNRADGRHIGLWYFDPYARDGKRSGAWMNAYRSQDRLDGKETTTLVSNNSNFVKGKPGEPVLISWDDGVTLFHEFGHALHGLCSRVTFPSLSGTNVARDFVEFPSQLFEHWLATPEVLSRFAVHYETGESMPPELVEKITASATFNQGFATVEYLASALIDMKLHLAGKAEIDPDSFERETLAALDMPRELVMRHRTPQFGHAFSSDGYSAGYYSYLWADVITADAFEAFTEASGPYDPDVAARLKKHVFEVGNTIDPAETYRKFRGRDPKIEALMKKRGFPVEA